MPRPRPTRARRPQGEPHRPPSAQPAARERPASPRDRAAERRDEAAERPLPSAVRCPFCASGDSELFSPFGSVASVAQYYCRGCRTVFDYVKWEAAGG